MKVYDCPKWDIEGGCEGITSSDTDTGRECYDCMKARQAHEAEIFSGLIDLSFKGGTGGNGRKQWHWEVDWAFPK